MRRALVAALLATVSCGGKEGPQTDPVASVTVTATASTLFVGATTQLSAQVRGADGTLITTQPVTWSSVTPGVLSVSAAGLATAVAAGQGTVRASAGGKSGDVNIVVTNPPLAALAFDRDSAVLTLPAGAVTLVPTARDSAGRVISNPTVFFSTDAPRVATVTQLGVVTAVAAGTAVISGSTEGITATMRVRVIASVTGSSPRVTSVTPMVAGGSAIISGSNFATSVGGNAVLVEGIAATVTAATSTQLTITLPAGGWACSAALPVTVQVNANNETGVGTGVLRTAIARSLAVGQSLVLTAASEARCNEIASTGGSYLVTVYNAARVMSGSEASFTLRGAAASSGAVSARANAAAGAAATVPPPAAPRRAAPAYPAIGSSRFARMQETEQEQRADAAHLGVMERSLAFARASGSPRAAWRRLRNSEDAATRAAGAVASQVATLGAITPLKIPNLDAQNFCTANIPIGVRTAWVGQRAIIVEDTTTVLNGTPTLKGQLDSLYAIVGAEFDTVMWPILTGTFGNPLAMDQQLSRTGKVVMLFSPRINALASGTIAGFVVSCDFYPVSQAPSSNVGEYFYAISPTSLASGYTTGTRATWLRSIRSTIIHEAKHITSFGERFSRNADFEEMWLEEGLARHAEEQFARGIYGVAWKGNTGYRASVYCDVRPSNASAPQCAGRPILMLRHLDALYRYLQAPEPYSLLGRVSPSDGSFYATSWSLVRWVIDHYATAEPAFLMGMVQSSQYGIANLEARTTGHLWEELVGEWALSLYTDDYPGVSFANARLQFPTWNLRDEFLGMCGDFGPCTNPSNSSTSYPVAFPLAPRARSFGTLSDQVTGLNGASFTSWLLSGTQSAPQLIELRGVSGGDAPAQLRLAIVRLP